MKSVTELAVMTGRGKKTIYRDIYNGKLPATKVSDRIYIQEDDAFNYYLKHSKLELGK